MIFAGAIRLKIIIRLSLRFDGPKGRNPITDYVECSIAIARNIRLFLAYCARMPNCFRILLVILRASILVHLFGTTYSSQGLMPQLLSTLLRGRDPRTT